MKSLFQKLSIAILLLVAPSLAFAQVQDSRIQMASLDHLAAKASQTVDVNIDGRLMRMAAKLLKNEGDEKEVKDLLAGIKGIYVKSFEFENDNLYSAADVESIRSQLRERAWSRLVNFTSKKEGNLEVYVLLNGESIGGLTVLSTDDREFTVVNIVGPVDLEKLSKLEGQFGIPELNIEPAKTAKPKNK
jgi:Domain of unknown function (DUF4252)